MTKVYKHYRQVYKVDNVSYSFLYLYHLVEVNGVKEALNKH